jgi:hypothetical protein
MTPILGIMASAISGHLGLSVDYLVVAGGGGGGKGNAGGGGAGGLRSTVTATGGGGSFRNCFKYGVKYFIYCNSWRRWC